MTFVDTGFFFALASEKDPDHARALEVWQSFRGRRLSELLVTTNHVVMECITLTRVRISHQAAVVMGERLYSEKMARIHWATPEDERAAFEYLKKHRDKEYSAVDCLSRHGQARHLGGPGRGRRLHASLRHAAGPTEAVIAVPPVMADAVPVIGSAGSICSRGASAWPRGIRKRETR